MIQDIFPHKLDNSFHPTAKPTTDSYVLHFNGRKVLVKTTPELDLPRVSDLKSETEYTYLFSIDNDNFFVPINLDFSVSDGFEYTDITALREAKKLQKPLLFAILTGKHLSDWYAISRFCGCCGAPMKHSATERAMCCTSCKNTVYPRIMPAVIVGVINGDSLLLTRYRTGYAHNALIAGFTEIGETLEETVAREVMEEAGLKVKNIRYYKSQPWGMAGDILAGFYCDVDGSDEIHMDEGELKLACWTERSQIELQPDDASLTNEMMKMFKEGRQ